MIDLFDATTRQGLLERLERLQADSPRQWGKMEPAQMLGHCTAALQVGTGDTPLERSMIGLLLGWMARKKLLGPEPFPRNSPTDPTFVVRDARDFAVEKVRLQAVIDRFVALGPVAAGTRTHSFLGTLSG